MRQRYSFHVDRAGHSITVNVRSGRITETELLVDGRECAFHRVHSHGSYPLTLSGQLPGEPPQPLVVTLDRTGRAEHPLACVLAVAGAEQPVPERTAR
ncbi:hypothetical protein ABZW30_19710 [Kitasatospora sp. NPDC004669]|uniref:hypothetical protein n=1 Tax=Kitasatospora sp. NPDC004669 TaxID=3154555 RepID=UPI0033B2D850